MLYMKFLEQYIIYIFIQVKSLKKKKTKKKGAVTISESSGEFSLIFSHLKCGFSELTYVAIG